MKETDHCGKEGITATAPLLPVALGLVIGVALDRTVALSPQVYLFSLAALTVVVWVRRVRYSIGTLLVLAASVCVGGALHWSSARTTPASSIERHADPAGRIARLRGRVISDPRVPERPKNPFAIWTYSANRTIFLMAVESIEGVDGSIAVTGKVRVTILEPVLDLRITESVEVFGRLYALTPQANPGSFDWESYNRRQGVVASLRCKHRENVRRLDQAPVTGLGTPIVWLRATARRLLTDDLAGGVDGEASLLEAMVLGQRSRLARRLNETFVAAGCIHFLAVSGVHLAIVMFFVGALCRMLRAGRRTCIYVMIIAVILYAVLAEPRPPILRASVIALTYCAARLIGRDRFSLNWISLAAILLTLLTPTAPFDVGFQLSFAAVLGVGFLAPALRVGCWKGRLLFERLILRRPYAEADRALVAAWRDLPKPPGPVRRGWRWFRRFLAQGLSITVAAWLAGLPIVATHFHLIHPWGALNSLLLLPLITLAMGLGFARIIFGALSPTLGALTGDMLGVVDSLLLGVVDQMAQQPGASQPVASPPWWMLASYGALLLVFAVRFRRGASAAHAAPSSPRAPASPSRLRSVPLAAAVVVFLGSVTVWHLPRRSTDRLVITVLSVGHAAATVIELPQGQTVLYDAGTSYASDVGHRTVIPFLRKRGIQSVERIYISHPNLDHFSGIPTIVDQIDTGPIYLNGYFESKSGPRSPSRHLLELLAARKHDLRALDPSATHWEFGGATFEMLSPPGDWNDAMSANDSSTVLRVSFAGSSVLLTGDIEVESQTALLRRGDLHADVLMLPHHGSVKPTTRAFVEAVRPEVVIRSSGKRADRNPNGAGVAKSALAEVVGGARYYNTADHGAVRVVMDRQGVHVFPCLERPGQ